VKGRESNEAKEQRMWELDSAVVRQLIDTVMFTLIWISGRGRDRCNPDIKKE